MPRSVPRARKTIGIETARALFMYTPGREVFEESIRMQCHASVSTTIDPEVERLLQRRGWEIVGPPPFQDTRQTTALGL